MRRTLRRNRVWLRYVLSTGLGVSTALTTGALVAQQPSDTGGQPDATAEADADAQLGADLQVDADADAQADASTQADTSPGADTSAPSGSNTPADRGSQLGADAQADVDAQAEVDSQFGADATRSAQDRAATADQSDPARAGADPLRAGSQDRSSVQGQAQSQFGAQSQNLGTETSDQQARLGVRMTDMQGGVIIEQVMPGSAAAMAGLQPGDRIISVNGQPLSGSQQMVGLVHGQSPGDTLDIVVMRNGQQQQLQATLAAWQGDREQRYSAARVDVGQEDRFRQLEQRLQQLEAEVQMLRQRTMAQPATGAALQPGAAEFDANATIGAGAAVSPPAPPTSGALDSGTSLDDRFGAGAQSDADDPSPETGKANIPD